MKKTLKEAIEEALKNPKDPNIIIFYPFTHYPIKYKSIKPPPAPKHNKINK